MSESKAIVVIRVSSVNQRHDIGNQMAYQTTRNDEAAERLGVDIVDTYEIVGSSTSVPLETIYERCKQDERILFILATSPNRLFRSFDAYMHWRQTLEKIGVYFEFTAPAFTNSSDDGLLKLSLDLAELENEYRSELTKKRIKEKAERGYHVNRPHFGYKTGDIPGLHIPNGGLWDALQDIYKSVASKETSLDKAIELLKGVRYDRGEWPENVPDERVVKLLLDPYYAGLVSFAGNTYPGLHKPLISEKEYMEIYNIVRRNGLGKNVKYLVCSDLESEEGV